MLERLALELAARPAARVMDGTAAAIAAGAVLAASRALAGRRGGPYGNGMGRLPSAADVSRAAGASVDGVGATADLLLRQQ